MNMQPERTNLKNIKSKGLFAPSIGAVRLTLFRIKGDGYIGHKFGKSKCFAGISWAIACRCRRASEAGVGAAPQAISPKSG